MYSDTTEECLESPSCGARYPGFLRGSHPENLEPGEEVERELCFAKNKKCCYKKVTMKVKKCVGYWVYELPRPSLRRARYCGDKGN